MISYALNKHYKGKKNNLFNNKNAKRAIAFHKKMDFYVPTKTHSLPELAKNLGVHSIYVKDESQRFNLNAFKALGGSYALARLLSKEHNIDINKINFKSIKENYANTMTFATATAGNHGTGVAWAAKKLGQKAIVYMPKGTPEATVQRVSGLGAQVVVTAVNYDKTVELANAHAKENNWFLVQDTAWEGYTEIPNWISQGYCTMSYEAIEQLKNTDITHVFLQSGVGSMAGAVLGHLTDVFGVNNFTTIVVEPESANCLLKSVENPDGMPTNANDINSIMKGLACGVLNPITWDILRDNTHMAISAVDEITKIGMRVLGKPIGKDSLIKSGPSGALPMGILHTITTDPQYIKICEELNLNQNSKILIFNTEGDTDPILYNETLAQ